MKSCSILLLTNLLAITVTAFPWLSPSFTADEFVARSKRTLEFIKRDPELVNLIRTTYTRQLQEKDDFFRNQIVFENTTQYADACENSELEKRQSTNCLAHPLQDFYPLTVAGLTRYPEAAYPYQDPQPSDQRGPCPGMNTLANHGYINRNGITTLAQTITAAARLFNMGADVTTVLTAGSILFAGDIPSLTYSIGGADARTNSLGVLGGSLGTETGLSGHLRFKEGDASGTRCDFYLCNGDNHNLSPTWFKQLQSYAHQYGGNQYNVPALIHQFANHYSNSLMTNGYFYFMPPSAPLAIGATYFIAGFFSNGTIGAGGVANEASIASFLGAYFDSSGNVHYQPEQIPAQGWYRRGYPLLLSEGIDAIFTFSEEASILLGRPNLFGANTGTPNSFAGQFSLNQFGGSTINGFACAFEEAVYGDFISEFSGILNIPANYFSTFASTFASYQCPAPTGAPSVEADRTTFPGYPKPQPCKLNQQQNGVNQCAPDTNTYYRFNTAKQPFCMNKPVTALANTNPLPTPGVSYV